MKTTKRKSKTAGKTPTPRVQPAEATLQATPERVLALASHCTIKEAAALKHELSAMAHEPTDVTLDVGSIERIDTATMQLLYAFVRDRAQRDQKVLCKGESQSWRDAVRLLGAEALLGSPAVAGAQR